MYKLCLHSTGGLAHQRSLAHMYCTCVLLQVIRTSSDSPPQYNATMNCIFAAQKDVSVKPRLGGSFVVSLGILMSPPSATRSVSHLHIQYVHTYMFTYK